MQRIYKAESMTAIQLRLIFTFCAAVWAGAPVHAAQSDAASSYPNEDRDQGRLGQVT